MKTQYFVLNKWLNEHASLWGEHEPVWEALWPWTVEQKEVMLVERDVVDVWWVISQRGVDMDQNKVKAVQNWLVPRSVKELQRFLHFSHFYWCFIRNFSITTAPLTSQLKGASRKLSWGQATDQAFQQLKDAFVTTPMQMIESMLSKMGPV